MDTKFTPGPWEIDRDPRPDMEWNNHIVGADGMTVCFMAHDNTKENLNGEANASLIAAAPDLLEALNALDRAIDFNDPFPDERKTNAEMYEEILQSCKSAALALAKVQP